MSPLLTLLFALRLVPPADTTLLLRNWGSMTSNIPGFIAVVIE